MARKTLSILLTLCMVLSLMPFGAFAANTALEDDTADGVTYVPADRLISGCKYLIVSGNSGSVSALSVSGRNLTVTPVEVDENGNITVDDSASVWTASGENGQASLRNSGGRYLNASSSLSSSSSTTQAEFGYENYQLKRTSKNSGSVYTVYYNGTAFASTSSTTDEQLFLFVDESTIPVPTPVPDPVTYERVEELADDVDFLIVSAAEDDAYALTNNNGSIGKTEVSIVNGKITLASNDAPWKAAANGDRFYLTNNGKYLEGSGGSVSIFDSLQNANRGWEYNEEQLQHVGGSNTYTVYYSGNAFTSTYNSTTEKVYLFAVEGAIKQCEHPNLTMVEGQAPTCTEDGFETYWQCADCERMFSDANAEHQISGPVVIPAAHIWGDWTLVTAAGATTPGSEKRVCSRCGEEDIRATDPTGVIEAGTYMIVMEGNVLTAVPSEKTMNTSTGYYYQGLDGVPYEEDMAVEPSMKWTITPDDNGGYLITNNGLFLNGTYQKPNNTDTYGIVHVDETSDVWTLVDGALKSANATADAQNKAKYLSYEATGTDAETHQTGVMDFFTVRSSGDQVTLILVEADVQCEHDYQAVVTAPTCTEAGYTTYTCALCGDSYVADPVDALGHDYKAVVTAPTCTEAGYTTYTCSRCGDSYVGDQVDALGHDFGAWTVTKAATCTETGIETRTCSRCDEVETRPVDALDHDYKADVTAPTCTEAGFTTYTCSRCGDSYVGDPVEALGHDYKAVVTAPTCTERGFTTYTCTRCGDEYVDNYVDALGHSWDEGVITQVPTATEDGEKTFTCTVCGETRTEPVPAIVNPFRDVPDGSYFHNAVLWAYFHDPRITNGTGEGIFAPHNTCTRAQAVTFLWRAKGCPEPTTTVNPFSDVAASAYYYKAVLWATENGIALGYQDGTFHPNDECTRAHVLTFLWRAQGKPTAATGASQFQDVPANAYYAEAVAWAVENGVTKGKTETTFEPNAACTRAHAVTFLYRALTE